MQKSELTLKEKVLLCVVAIIALGVIFYMFLLSPQLSSIASMQTKLTDKQKEVSQYENFDKTIEDTNKEVNDYKLKVLNSTEDWHDVLIQHDILKDLEEKIEKASLYDTNITFTNVQQMNIVKDKTDKEEIPSLSESIAMAYLCLTQEESEKNKDNVVNINENSENKTEKTEDAAKEDDTAANTKKSASASPDTSGVVLNPDVKAEKEEFPEVDPSVTTSFESFKKSLDGLSDEQIREEVKKIMAKSNTNITKLDISVAFQDSTYDSIVSFLNRINAESPKIYITSISYSDSTEAYISNLNKILQTETAQKQREAAASGNDFFENKYPSAATTKAQINEGATVKYNGDPRYTGSITITYFSLVKIPFDELDAGLAKENDDIEKIEEKENENSAKL